MTPQARLRRIGWFALLGVCTLLYSALHFHVWTLSSEVKKAERQIVSLERQNMLLETEFLTRSSQLQLAAWNRVDFGYTAPRADQFIASERQLARFGQDGGADAGQPIRVAAFSADEEAPPFPKLVSPITGRALDEDLVNPAAASRDDADGGEPLVIALAQGAARVPLAAAPSRSGRAAVRVVLGGADQ